MWDLGFGLLLGSFVCDHCLGSSLGTFAVEHCSSNWGTSGAELGEPGRLCSVRSICGDPVPLALPLPLSIR